MVRREKGRTYLLIGSRLPSYCTLTTIHTHHPCGIQGQASDLPGASMAGGETRRLNPLMCYEP